MCRPRFLQEASTARCSRLGDQYRRSSTKCGYIITITVQFVSCYIFFLYVELPGQCHSEAGSFKHDHLGGRSGKKHLARRDVKTGSTAN